MALDSLTQSLLSGGDVGAMMNNPRYDGTLTLKSPAQPNAAPAAADATPAAGGGMTPLLGGDNISPNTMGGMAALAGLGGTLAGGKNTVMGQLGQQVSSFYQNALQQQQMKMFLQMLMGGGGGAAAGGPANPG